MVAQTASLTNNVNNRIRLFSDNVQDASAEGRCIRTAKTKMVYYWKIAEAIFKNDWEEKDHYTQDPERYAKSVENHIQGLKQKYRTFNKSLGQTGAGLRAEDIEEGTDLHNLITQLSVDFPYWECLHGFWHTMLNFNPYTQSAEHGQDLVARNLKEKSVPMMDEEGDKDYDMEDSNMENSDAEDDNMENGATEDRDAQ